MNAAPTEPLVVLRFSVRDPVGKNAMYARGKGRRLYITDQGVAFQQRVAYAAINARAIAPRWPLAGVDRVRITCQLYNTRHDAGAVTTAVKDALEGILYANDRIVSHGPEELPIKDAGGRRVEITAELLEVREIVPRTVKA